MGLGLVGTLRARLGLNPAPFNRGLNKAETHSRGFASRVGKNIALMGAAMAAAAVAGIGAIVRKSMLFIDQQAKIARTIDGTVDGLRALQIAAGDAGVAQSDLNKSMQMIGARLVEAEVKGGASADALDRLGLSAKNLLELDADKRLAAIADRVKELGLSSSQTTQFLMDMGVRSKAMSLLLTGGGDAIRAARKEVDELGLSLSAVDAAKVEQANDAMARIGRTGEAAGNRFAVAFAPALQSIAEGFRGSMREGGAFRGVIETIGQRVSGLVDFARDFVTISNAIIQNFKTMAGEGTVFASLMSPLSGLLKIFQYLKGGVSEAVSTLAHLIRTTGSWGDATAALAPLMSEVMGRIKLGFSGLVLQMQSGWLRTRADAVEASAGILGALLGAANKIIGGYVGASAAIIAAFGALPAALRRIGALAVNGLIDVIGTGVKGMLTPLNSILEAVGLTPIPAPDLSSWKAEVGTATDAAGDAKAAFDSAFGVDYVNASGLADGARATVADLRSAGDLMAEFGDNFKTAAGKPLTELEKLRGVVTEATDAATDGMNDAALATTDFDTALGGGGGSGGAGGPATKIDKIKSSVEVLNEKLGETKSVMQSAFTGLITGAKSVGDALSDMLGRFAEMAANSVFNSLWGSVMGSIGGSGFGNILGGLPSFAGGGSTGNGPRSGGLDGKGGFLAMMHPQEQVYDGYGGGARASRGVSGGGGLQEVIVRVLGGDLTLSDDGLVLAHVQTVAETTTARGIDANNRNSPLRTKTDINNPRRRY
jgi:hypothetical protein